MEFCSALPFPPAPVWFGSTNRVLLPSRLMEAWTAFCDPVPTATRVMTDAMPMTMPSIVSTERILLAATPASANRVLSRILTVRLRRSGAGWGSPR